MLRIVPIKLPVVTTLVKMCPHDNSLVDDDSTEEFSFYWHAMISRQPRLSIAPLPLRSSVPILAAVVFWAIVYTRNSHD